MGLLDRLFYDWAIDGLLSFLDNFLFGLGLSGIDVGDWLAAGIILHHEWGRSGPGWAFLYAWEAANFPPFSFMPGVGEVLETITGIFPAMAIFGGWTDKTERAEQSIKKLEEYVGEARTLGINIGNEQQKLQQAFEYMEQGKPYDAWKLIKHEDYKLARQLATQIGSLLQSVEEHLERLPNLQGPEDLILQLENGMTRSAELLKEGFRALEEKDFLSAEKRGEEAEEIYEASVESYNAGLQMSGRY